MLLKWSHVLQPTPFPLLIVKFLTWSGNLRILWRVSYVMASCWDKNVKECFPEVVEGCPAKTSTWKDRGWRIPDAVHVSGYFTLHCWALFVGTPQRETTPKRFWWCAAASCRFLGLGLMGGVTSAEMGSRRVLLRQTHGLRQDQWRTHDIWRENNRTQRTVRGACF